MARWKKTWKEFEEVRQLILNDDIEGILPRLSKICEKYAKQKWIFSDDFDDLRVEIDYAIEEEDFDEESVDYYLDEFYDLCDAAGVWLGV